MTFFIKLVILFSIVYIIMLCLLPNTKGIAAQPGYCVLPDKNVNYQIVKIARSMLNNPLGSCTNFNFNNKNYQGCVEYHWDEIKGKHIGVTVYIQCDQK